MSRVTSHESRVANRESRLTSDDCVSLGTYGDMWPSIVPPRGMRTLTPFYATSHPRHHGRRNGLVTTLEQFSRLVFCRAVFMESLRLRPAATRLVLHNVVGWHA